MEEVYKTIFLIGAIASYAFTGVQASGRSRWVSEVPASSPDASPVQPPVSAISASAPGPSQEDIDINFDSVTNVADLVPKFENINNFDFSSMKIDTTAKDLCKGTDYNNECLAAILPDLQQRAGAGNRGLEPKDVMRMEAESLFKKANATLEYAKRLMKDSETEMPLKEAMSVCVESYDSLVFGLEDARAAMDRGDYGKLESILSGAISDVSTCSDTFTDIPGVDSPTASLDDLIKKLCSNILAMSHNLHNR